MPKPAEQVVKNLWVILWGGADNSPPFFCTTK